MFQNILGKKNPIKKVDCKSMLVVYPAKGGGWRGFVHPYDITTEADTKQQAVNALQEMAETYEDMLKEYDYPEHLCVKPMSNEEDRALFDQIKIDALAARGKVNTNQFYAEAVYD